MVESDERIKKLVDTARGLEGMPRNTSAHAAGVVITANPVSDYVPLARNDETIVTQFTMTTIEELGLLKMDFLGLRNLTILDDAARAIRRRARHIGYVMQNPNQMISKTMIFDEVAMGLQGTGLSEDEIRARVEETLKICGLYPFRNWPISALSFGQKKRVTIASVLVQDPELIILDEPTAGQDFRHYTDIMEFLRGLNAKGVTVVMITHDMHLMLEYTPRALAFCDGRLIADRSAAAILCDPALIEQAALKETSLYTLANRCGIAPAEDFVERFIAADREVRADGC